ncbi:hypothetical protein GCM10011594_15130 [Nakamurella endophytica]|uniref:DUF2029 domain-containing protein n=1 Tax=Nakamurella endophytica TaxID=1748367 RepID=A0A917ST43_9ACTN|nr:hypothetical protein GCM10011594_15130 [Nakamurella endophytica]
MKLTPGVFLLYFLLARQWRAAVVSLLSAIGATAVAAVFAPVETWQYWTSLVWDPNRVGFVGSSDNQSLNGLLHRLADPSAPSGALWLAATVAVLAVAVPRIRSALDAGDLLAAVTLTGLLGALVSPVTWVHHIVWVIPAAVVIATRLVRMLQAAVAAPSASLHDVRRRARRAVVPAVLVVSGIPALGFDVRRAFSLPFTDYADAGPLAALAASLPMLWTLAAVLLLPVSTAAAPAAPGPGRWPAAAVAG